MNNYDQAMADVIEALAGSYNRKGIIDWFMRPRHDLDGKRPYEVWEDDPQRVVDLAKRLGAN